MPCGGLCSQLNFPGPHLARSGSIRGVSRKRTLKQAIPRKQCESLTFAAITLSSSSMSGVEKCLKTLDLHFNQRLLVAECEVYAPKNASLGGRDHSVECSCNLVFPNHAGTTCFSRKWKLCLSGTKISQRHNSQNRQTPGSFHQGVFLLQRGGSSTTYGQHCCFCLAWICCSLQVSHAALDACVH